MVFIVLPNKPVASQIYLEPQCTPKFSLYKAKNPDDAKTQREFMTHGASLSSFLFLFSIPITLKSGPAVAAPWITICGSRIRGRNGGSSMAESISCGLIVVVMADPVSRWHHIMVVDHDHSGR
ncbi:unnamed protein product [Pleuronectes platessa]|uniref:Uncharacterized protein n=1 Tax=Pleuronectes platessa TaxID=8262 RepID=A0A9N7YEQ3_PLEPL|nr:unnamed protein product [Pleuronectes platessa]